jgi:antitoxin component of MazEF toxin-antitoxin module
MGSCKAQESGNSIYSLIPPEFAESLDVSQGSTLELGFHAESNTLLVALDGDLSGSDEGI